MLKKLARVTIVVELFRGERRKLLPLFREADDSEDAIKSYLSLGEVLVARRPRKIVGYVQLISRGTDWEIKSLALMTECRRQGIGSALVRESMKRAFAAGAVRVVVATATADINNLEFYQRLGFRMDRIEHDAFTPKRGYPGLYANGIPLRDAVWLSIDAK